MFLIYRKRFWGSQYFFWIILHNSFVLHKNFFDIQVTIFVFQMRRTPPVCVIFLEFYFEKYDFEKQISPLDI